jgi:hypothetical protein
MMIADRCGDQSADATDDIDVIVNVAGMKVKLRSNTKARFWPHFVAALV